MCAKYVFNSSVIHPSALTEFFLYGMVPYAEKLPRRI
jgi:hypothetical protein